jgi:hypothetical protein
MPTLPCVLPLPKRGEEKLMGVTHVTVRIMNPADSQRSRSGSAKVETGRSNCINATSCLIWCKVRDTPRCIPL